MTNPREVLQPQSIIDEKLGWDIASDYIQATFATGDFMTGVRFINLIAESAEAANHHPDISLHYGAVVVELSSHDVGGITIRDISLAQQINNHASALGLAFEA
ncbi:4a-hydroxytetrahydrobiopterin dehydratase [Corynebacterium callunae]|uniref:4a-hydroxytetrahydrobiopterin dehydratase n=1 Tax=Corynebacterium callunae TaxID=1721 RepID=UPI003981D4BE